MSNPIRSKPGKEKSAACTVLHAALTAVLAVLKAPIDDCNLLVQSLLFVELFTYLTAASTKEHLDATSLNSIYGGISTRHTCAR